MCCDDEMLIVFAKLHLLVPNVHLWFGFGSANSPAASCSSLTCFDGNQLQYVSHLNSTIRKPSACHELLIEKKHIVTWCQPVHISTNRPKVQGLLGNFMDFHRLHWKILHFTRQVTPEEWISRSFRCTVGLAKSSRRSRCSSKTVSLASCH